MNFVALLKNNGWLEILEDWEYRKGSWVILRDTGNWWMLGTINTPRLFDIPELDTYYEVWIVNLIEHLCKSDDELNRFRKADKI